MMRRHKGVFAQFNLGKVASSRLLSAIQQRGMPLVAGQAWNRMSGAVIGRRRVVARRVVAR